MGTPGPSLSRRYADTPNPSQLPLCSQMSKYDLMGLGWGLSSREVGLRDAACRGDSEADLQGAWRVQARRGRRWEGDHH